jgi:hypothetical protein
LIPDRNLLAVPTFGFSGRDLREIARSESGKPLLQCTHGDGLNTIEFDSEV